MSDETQQTRTIGRYVALDEIGRGAMGIVYRGFDPVIGRPVALKTIVLGGTDAESVELKQRLYREAGAAGVLAHPNIVTIYDIVEQGPTIAIAMELVEGATLQSVIAERGPLAMEEALRVLEQICAALDFASERSIVHRDIKPSNIHVTRAGAIKVMDFGVARLERSEMTRAGVVLGSPRYMSPEQVRGLSLDGRSDLFSAAVVFYEMITRERPFAGTDIATTMYRIVHEPPTPAWQLNPGVSQQVDAVLEKALAKNPADRYPTGAAMVAAFRQAHEEAELEGRAAVVTPSAAPAREAAGATSLDGEAPGAVAPPPSAAARPYPVPPAASDATFGIASMPLVAGSSVPATAATEDETGALAVPLADTHIAAPALPTPAPPAAPSIPPAKSSPTVRPTRSFPLAAVVTLAAACVIAGGGAWWVLGRRPAPVTETAGGQTGQAHGTLAETPPPLASQVFPVVADQTAGLPKAPASALPAPGGRAQPAPATGASRGADAEGRGKKATGSAGAQPSAREKPAPAAALPQPATAAPQAAQPSPPPVPMPAKTYEVTEVDVKPALLRQVPPTYPEEARRQGLQDVIIVRALVTENGEVADARITRRAQKDPSFEQAALAAVRQWSFKPAEKRGKPVACWFSVGVPFSLPK